MDGDSRTVRCDVSGYLFARSMVRACHEPNVARRYGRGGTANVSVYVCMRCRNAIHYRYHGGVSCGLECCV